MTDSQAKKRTQLTRQKSLDSSPPRAKAVEPRPKTLDLQQASSSKAGAKHHAHTDTSPKRKKASSNGHGNSERESPKGAQKESPKGGHVKVHQTSSGSPKQAKKIPPEAIEMKSGHRHKDDVMLRSKR